MSATVNWGKGRPKIASVVSSTTTADVPLAAGDTITVTFEAPTDQSGNGDKAFVDALLQARNSSGGAQFGRAILPTPLPRPQFRRDDDPSAVLATDYSGAWTDASTCLLYTSPSPRDRG